MDIVPVWWFLLLASLIRDLRNIPSSTASVFIKAEYSFNTISDVKNSTIVTRIRHCSVQFNAELKLEFICRLS